MILPLLRASFHPLYPSSSIPVILRRSFASSKAQKAKNRVYSSPRSPDEWSTLLLLSTSSRRPLITLWTSASCKSCAAVLPIVKGLIEDEGVGENEGGVGFAECEVDAVLMGGGVGVAVDYGINAMPTLMAFDKNEPQVESKVTNLNDLKNKDFLRRWIEKEASRQGGGGAGGSFFGLFKSKL